jgi:Zn/Cd-binding protein ZinT
VFPLILIKISDDTTSTKCSHNIIYMKSCENRSLHEELISYFFSFTPIKTAQELMIYDMFRPESIKQSSKTAQEYAQYNKEFFKYNQNTIYIKNQSLIFFQL